MRITGNMVNYYFVCPRKLWLFSRELRFEENSERVALGKILDESSYDRNNKHVMVDNVVNIDMIQHWQVIHEIKRTRAIDKAAEWQLKYYIYYLRKKGIQIDKGIIDYPLLKEKVTINYTSADESKMKTILNKISGILCQSQSPSAKKKSICKSCAYYEYCFV